jgi:large subunit ribosomal protein L29
LRVFESKGTGLARLGGTVILAQIGVNGAENAMTKATQLREMSDDQLQFSLTEAQKELFRLRFQAATEKLDAPSNLRKLRREIARIHTLQRERTAAASRKT